MAKSGRTRLFLILAVPIALLALFFATAAYRDDGLGVHYIGRPPLVSVSWGPSRRYIVQSGIPARLTPLRLIHVPDCRSSQ